MGCLRRRAVEIATLKIWLLFAGVNLSLRGMQATDDTCAKDEYDFIIVGVGSAGSVITARLSEDPNVKVLALEAGEKAEEFTKMPYFSKFIQISHMTWKFKTTKQEACCKLFEKQRVVYTQGKALGGSSAINGLQYTRGCKRDYDNWAEQGNEGWSYDDVFPYFLKIEDYRVPHSPYDEKFHNKGGPISVEHGKSRTPIADAILQGGFELGYPIIDVNGEYAVGFSNSVQNTKDGSRCSAYTGYLEPALNRTNMRIETGALVTKILFDDNKKAVGVTYVKKGKLCNVAANKEVIVSAGAINSPKLLLLSGIGPAETLKKHKIPIVYASSGVGQNLQDHPEVLFPISINQSITYRSLFNFDNIKLWLNSKTGPMTNSFGIEGTAYFSSGLSSHPNDWPDLEFLFISDDIEGMNWLPEFNKEYTEAIIVPGSITITLSLQRPKSSGNMTLLSTNIEHPPIINLSYLTHEDDINILVKGIEKLVELVNTKAFQQYGAKIPDVISPHCNKKSLPTEEYHKCIVRSVTTAGLHASGTCKMGPKSDKMAVVDNRLRVYGVEGLRVADSSIMPNVLVAHLNAPCMMIGEKAADMIKQDNQ